MLHTALRRPPTRSAWTSTAQDVVADVHDVLRPGLRLRRPRAQRRVDRRHRRADPHGGQHRDRRLRPRAGDGLRGARAVPRDGRASSAASSRNIDPTDAATKLAGLDPATTLFIVSSKTFGTLETLTNARLCKAWLLDGLSGSDAGRRRRRSTSSRSRPRSTRSRRSASTPPTRSASGTGSAAATRWTPPIGTSLAVAIGPSGSPSCSPASMPWTSTSARTEPARERAAADGAAERLVHQLPRRADATRCSPTPSCCTGSRRTSSS